MTKGNWSRARAVTQPRKSAAARYDHDNSIAAGIILATPQRHSRCQVDWARQFTIRMEAQREGRRGQGQLFNDVTL